MRKIPKHRQMFPARSAVGQKNKPGGRRYWKKEGGALQRVYHWALGFLRRAW